MGHPYSGLYDWKYSTHISTLKTEIVGMCWRNTKKVKIEIEVKVLGQIYDLICLENMMSELKEGVYMKLQKYSMLPCYVRDVALKICLVKFNFSIGSHVVNGEGWLRIVIDSQL